MLIDNETYCPGSSTQAEPPLRKLKASEAMRLGATMKPQCQGMIYFDGRSCAIGAMYDGWGIHSSLYEKAQKHFHSSSFVRMIWQHNDEDHWTREQIADWLEDLGW